MCVCVCVMIDRLFPYTDMYRWLSYDNGNCHDALACQRHIFTVGVCASVYVCVSVCVCVCVCVCVIDAKSQDPLVRKNYFYHREFSFTIKEMYMRYKSFKTLKDFRNTIQSKCPDKIDIGAIFNAPVRFYTMIVFSFLLLLLLLLISFC